MFGLLWDVPFRFPVGKQSAGLVPKGHIAPFPTVVKMAFRGDRGAMRIASCFIGLAAYGKGNTQRHLAP